MKDTPKSRRGFLNQGVSCVSSAVCFAKTVGRNKDTPNTAGAGLEGSEKISWKLEEERLLLDRSGKFRKITRGSKQNL